MIAELIANEFVDRKVKESAIGKMAAREGAKARKGGSTSEAREKDLGGGGGGRGS